MKTLLRISVAVIDENGIDQEKMAVTGIGPASRAPVRAMIEKLLAELEKIGIQDDGTKSA